MFVSLIAAVSDDGFIGQQGGIPWRLPRDVAHFRAYASGKWLLLGRRTYEEMTGWFTNHHPLVLSHSDGFAPAVGQRVESLAAAIAAAQTHGAEELVVLGGGEVFALALPFASRLILTQVHTNLWHGVRFPDWSIQEWRCLEHSAFPADRQHSFPHSIATYQRINPPLQS